MGRPCELFEVQTSRAGYWGAIEGFSAGSNMIGVNLRKTGGGEGVDRLEGKVAASKLRSCLLSCQREMAGCHPSTGRPA